MFKKIQKYLLINHPLLWNTKIVPLTCFLIAAHIIFFVIGYCSGTLNFNDTQRISGHRNTDLVFFFSVMISLITLILWVVYYFKNNGYKSFYPKNNFALLREWCIILFASILLCTLQLSYLNGFDARLKSYYSKEEAIRRCEIIGKASLFYGERYDAPKFKDSLIKDTLHKVAMDVVVFNGKKYPMESLINKDMENFSFFDISHDSLAKRKIKLWLINGQADSVKIILKDYFKLVNEHKLTSNINESQWFTLVYNPPTFKTHKIVAKRELSYFGDHNDYYGEDYEATIPGKDPEAYDTINQYVRTQNGEKFVYNKAFVPADELEFNYERIADAYMYPAVSSDLFLAAFYFALALSILIFSFRVNSGRNWLIALISMGVLNILLGIISAVFRSEYVYIGGIIALFLAALSYFITIILNKRKKGISAIALIHTLWLLPAIIPAIYALVLEILQDAYYNSYAYTRNNELMIENPPDPTVEWMRDNFEPMLWLNLLFVLLVMLWLSVRIKKWKGIAES